LSDDESGIIGWEFLISCLYIISSIIMTDAMEIGITIFIGKLGAVATKYANITSIPPM